MRAIFSIRGLLFIWIVITGSIALISHLHGMATELRNSMQASANFITGIYNWINGGAASLGMPSWVISMSNLTNYG